MAMKKAWIYACLLLVLIQLGGCNQTEDGSYVAPISIYEKIDGNWSFTTVKLVDELAKAKGQTISEVNISSKFNYNTATLSFNEDEKGNPTTYQVTGDVPELFALSGYWNLSNPYPNTDGTSVKINLYSDAAKTQLTDQLLLTAIPGTSNTMEFKLVRYWDSRAYVSYSYVLNPIAQ